MHEIYELHGYQHTYFQRLLEGGLSEHQYALLCFLVDENSRRLQKSTIFLASSEEELEMKLAVVGFKKGKEKRSDSCFVEYEVEKIS